MWTTISCLLVFTMFVVSLFTSYRSEKRHIMIIRKQRKKIDELLEQKQKDKDYIDQLSRRLLKQYETIAWLSGEKNNHVE